MLVLGWNLLDGFLVVMWYCRVVFLMCMVFCERLRLVRLVLLVMCSWVCMRLMLVIFLVMVCFIWMWGFILMNMYWLLGASRNLMVLVLM